MVIVRSGFKAITANNKTRLTMKTEQKARNSRDNSDEKLMAALEYLLTTEQASDIYSAINDPIYEVGDIIEMIDDYTITFNPKYL